MDEKEAFTTVARFMTGDEEVEVKEWAMTESGTYLTLTDRRMLFIPAPEWV